MSKTLTAIIILSIVAGAGYYFRPNRRVTVASRSSGRTASLQLPKLTAIHVPVAIQTEDSSAIQILLRNLLLSAESGHSAETPEAIRDITQFLLTHPESIADVIRTFENETDPEKLILLSSVVAEQDNPENRSLIARNGSRILENDPSFTRRKLALDWLSKMSAFESGLLETVARAAFANNDAALRLAAVETMTAWLSKNPDRTEELAAALSNTLDNPTDELVRARTLQVLAQQSWIPSKNTLNVAAELLTGGGTESRIAAAMILQKSPAEMKPAAVLRLETAYGAEANTEVKRNYLPTLVALAGKDALSVLHRLPTDLRLSQDIDDYLRIAEAGKLASIDEIYEQKFAIEAERNGATSDTTSPRP